MVIKCEGDDEMEGGGESEKKKDEGKKEMSRGKNEGGGVK